MLHTHKNAIEKIKIYGQLYAFNLFEIPKSANFMV